MVARAGDKVEGKLQVQALSGGSKVQAPEFRPLPLVAPRFLANERAEVFDCDWAPLDGHSHQTSPRLASTVSVHIDPCNKSLALQRPATTMDPRHTRHTKDRVLVRQPDDTLFPLRLPFMGTWSRIEGSQLSGVLVSSPQLVMFGLVQVKATPGCTEQPGSCAPEERISESFQKCLRADSSSLLEKYLLSRPKNISAKATGTALRV
jgi:hypothetical protein